METNDSIQTAYFDKPSLILRLKSMMIDGVVLILLMFLMSLLLESLKVESGLVRGLCFGLIFLYEPILVSISGTVGQNVMGISVLNYGQYSTTRSKQRINIFQSLIRYITKFFLGWVSLLTIHSSHYGQALHDKLGNSVMIFR
jgi:hypothetical protein